MGEMDWKQKALEIGVEAAAVPQIQSGDVPDLELYMDQLVTLLDRRLGSIKREQDTPFITNTMVNNYTKARLIPPAEHKRYQSRHVLGLSLVGQLKKVLSMQDLGRITTSAQQSGQENALYDSFLTAQREAFDSAGLLLQQAAGHCEAQGLEGNTALAAMATELAAQAQCRVLLAERLLDLLEQPKQEEGKKKKA